MGRLFIAEKPSVAKAIAAELDGPQSGSDGYRSCGDDVVTWCFGHLLELASPDEYTDADIPRNKSGKKRWRVEDLPILPERWLICPKPEAKKQLRIIGQLLKRQNLHCLVNAGDPDREGQLLVDQVLEHFKTKKPVLRFWVSAQDKVSIARGLKSLKDNGQYAGWAAAARARSRADWLTGMNLSRAYTLACERSGNSILITFGRVQTPTLALVVARDRAIEQFVPIPFYAIEAHCLHSNGEFTAHWKPSEQQRGLDGEGRLLDGAIAESLCTRLTNSQGKINNYEQQRKSQPHPLAFSLADITLLGSNLYGYSAETTLKTCQALYERHKLTSYPRTDTGYLPESQHDDASAVLASLSSIDSKLQGIIQRCDPSLRSRTWNDKRVTAHHGIIPTQHAGSLAALNEPELRLFELIARRYIAQFYPLHQYLATNVSVSCKDEYFVATGKVVIEQGWRIALPGGHKDKEQLLPTMVEGDPVRCNTVQCRESKTKPPSRFSEGSLVQAMSNIHKSLSDPAQRKALRDGDGLGTSSSRANIIADLRRREYLKSEGKHLISTPFGRSMTDAFPEELTSPVLTAINERDLKAIEQGQPAFDEFMKRQADMVSLHVQSLNTSSVSIEGAPTRKSKPPRRTRTSKCVPASSDHICGACQNRLVRRESKTKGQSWWGCSNFPRCRQTYQDAKGVPDIA